MTRLNIIYDEINRVSTFLDSIENIIASHLNDFFVNELWNSLPEQMKIDLLHGNLDDLNLNESGTTYEIEWDFKSSNLLDYLYMSSSCNLDHLSQILVTDDISNSLFNSSNLPRQAFNNISTKKRHEIMQMTDLVSSLCSEQNIQSILDLGSGLGYLSSFLSELCGFNVLAVDASQHHISGMMERTQKLKKMKTAWTQKGIVSLPTGGVLRGTSQFIRPDCDIKHLLATELKSQDVLEQENPLVAVTGLHICGNLSPISCKLFAENNCAKILVNVGCCYHLIQEQFENDIDHQWHKRPLDERYENYDLDPLHQDANIMLECGFPLSNILKNRKYSLGKTARMLASQRPINIKEESKTSKLLFWRALLQKIVVDRIGGWPENVLVGRKIVTDHFNSYCNTALQNINAGFTLTENETDQYQKMHSSDKQFHMYKILRSHAAPAIETLLVLDKLAYLLEKGFKNSQILEIFEERVSPRRWCIISRR